MQDSKKESLFYRALCGKNQNRPPVWLMRQAGRYLPQYRSLRQKHSLYSLFFTPELALQVTCMPVDLLGVDAAILFSDIMVIALALGLQLDFQEGPVVSPWVTPDRLSQLSLDLSPLEPVFQTIRLLNAQLTVPLIGFCGAPFTVATYFVKESFRESWLASDPIRFQQLLLKIEEATIQYIHHQIEAGVVAIQIFDSWANLLSSEEFRLFCLPSYERIIAQCSVPVILFMRGIGMRLQDLYSLPCSLSLDWEVEPSDVRKKTKQTLQGNLNPALLYEPLEIIVSKTKALLASMDQDSGFIVNLGHGVRPDTPVEAVRAFVHTVKERKEKRFVVNEEFV